MKIQLIKAEKSHLQGTKSLMGTNQKGTSNPIQPIILEFFLAPHVQEYIESVAKEYIFAGGSIFWT